MSTISAANQLPNNVSIQPTILTAFNPAIDATFYATFNATISTAIRSSLKSAN